MVRDTLLCFLAAAAPLAALRDDDPDDRDLRDALGNPQGRLRNIVCEGHVEVRPRGPLVVGFEFRRLKTTYRAGDFSANHLNVAAGYRF